MSRVHRVQAEIRITAEDWDDFLASLDWLKTHLAAHVKDHECNAQGMVSAGRSGAMVHVKAEELFKEP